MPTSLVASVVFLKIQDFARRPASEQARLRAQLEAVVAVTTAELDPASRIVLDASDGVAIVVMQDAKGALRLAERALTAGVVGLPLCAGLNHGALQLSGRKGGEGMTGDGLAVAAAVAEFADASRLLATRAFRDAVADAQPGAEVALVAAGVFNDPGLRTHELFMPDRRAVRRRERRYVAASVALSVALVAAGIGWRISVDGQEPFVNSMIEKYSHVRALVQKVSF